MRAHVDIGRWLAAILLCLSTATGAAADLSADRALVYVHAPPPTPAPAPAPAILGSLVDRLDTWLDLHVEFPRRDPPPGIRWISPQAAAKISGAPHRGYGPTRALYDPEAAMVYLVEPWSAADPQDVSVLLHELVHHRQVGRPYACRGAQELPAYRAQAAWLTERGLELDVNWIAIILDAGCRPHDVHPE